MGILYGTTGIIAAILCWKKKELRRSSVVVLVGCLGALLLWTVFYLGGADEPLHVLEREDKTGALQRVVMEAEAEGEDKRQTLEMQIAPLAYTWEELQELSGQLLPQLEQIILAENESPDYVTRDLCFPERVEGFPFTLKWSTDVPGLLSSQGKLERAPEREGELAGIHIQLLQEAQGFAEEHVLYVRIFPSGESSAFWKRLEQSMTLQEEDSREQMAYRLPEQFEGKWLRFYEKRKDSSISLFLLAIFGGVAAAVGQKREQEKREQDRLAEIDAEYGEMVSRMTMLVGAGMTISGAFRRMAGEYGRKKQKKKKLLYEELQKTCREMESGISERTAYQNLGTRNGAACLIRFTALLSQYTQSGAVGLKQALQEETGQALKERKERVRRLGEEAGTKLLLPMILMLVLVMVIVMLPAFTSFGLG